MEPAQEAAEPGNSRTIQPAGGGNVTEEGRAVCFWLRTFVSDFPAALQRVVLVGDDVLVAHPKPEEQSQQKALSDSL